MNDETPTVREKFMSLTHPTSKEILALSQDWFFSPLQLNHQILMKQSTDLSRMQACDVNHSTLKPDAWYAASAQHIILDTHQ